MNTAKPLPRALTSYDLIKAVAVIIMIIDHIGFYFFPENEWWRAVGRIGFPVWFFFVGHASGRDLSPRLLGGAALLAVASAIVSMPVFPLNALVTIILIRLLLDRVAQYAGQGISPLAQVIVMLTILALPTSFLTEYGTLGLIFALFGYVVRHRDSFMPDRNIVLPLTIVCFLIFAGVQQLAFDFTQLAFLLMGGGTFFTCMILSRFRAREYPALSARIPAVFKAPIQFMGRRTLEIYIAHLLAFKVLAAILNPDVYPLFQFRLFM